MTVTPHRSKIWKCIVAITIPVVVATSCVGIGVQHSHDGGHQHHSHRRTHTHSHGGHPHSHYHSDDSPQNDDHGDTHIHVAVLGFVLTLTCESPDRNVAQYSSKTTSRDVKPGDATLVDLRSDAAPSELFQILTFMETVMPERMAASQGAGNDVVAVLSYTMNGRCRDMPLTPPPEVV